MLVDTVMYYSSIATFVVEIIAIAFFIVQYVKKNPTFSSAYFYISTLRFSIHVITNVSTFFTSVFEDNSVLPLIDNILQWYGYLVMGPISVILTLNRFTAMVFLRRFKEIWTFPRTIVYLAPVLLVPFAVNAKNIIKLMKCLLQVPLRACPYVIAKMITIQVYTMLTCCVLCVIFTIGSIIAARYNTGFKGTSTTAKVERRLLIQCSVSTVFFCFSITSNFFYTKMITQLTDYTDEDQLYIDILLCVSTMSLQLLYTTDALMLLLISEGVRKTFIKFLLGDKLMKLWHRFHKKSEMVSSFTRTGNVPSTVMRTTMF